MPTWRGWTDEAVAVLRALAPEGKSASQIALPLGCSRNAVISKARQLGVKLGRRQAKSVAAENYYFDALYRPRLPLPPPVEVKPVLALAPKAPPAKAKRGPASVAWTEARNEEFRRKFAEGLPIKRIAREMRAAPRTVRLKIEQFGLERDPACLVSKFAERTVVAPEPPPAREGGVLIWDLHDHQCNWPLWGSDVTSVDERYYCGAAQEPRSAYCPFHTVQGTSTAFRRTGGKLSTVSRFTGSAI